MPSMFRQIITIFAVVATTAELTFARKREHTVARGEAPSDYPGVGADSGILVFDDQRTFQETITRLKEEDKRSEYADEAMVVFEKALGFSSLRGHLFDLEEEGEELSPEQDFVADDYLATTLSPHYEILIGSTGYILDPKNTIEVLGVSAGDLVKIREGGLEGYKVIKHVNDPNQDDRENHGDGRQRQLQGGVDPCDGWQSCSAFTTYANGSRRHKGRVWVQNYPFYATMGGRTKNYERKNNGGWRRERADRIEVQVGVLATDISCTELQPGNFGDIRNNRRSVQETRNFWGQITRANALVSFHEATDNGDTCGRNLDAFNCDTATLSCDPTPSPTPGPSCMSGDTGVFDGTEAPKRGEGAAESSSRVKPVRDLQLGDEIRGLDANMQPATCTVEAKGYFDQGPVFGNYTDDHYILDAGSHTMTANGADGLAKVVDKYAVLTSCPLGLDESGVGFTPLDSDFFGPETRSVSWPDYVLVHTAILRAVRASGSFWFSPSSYVDMDVVAKYTPALYGTMVQCMKEPQECEEFENAAGALVENSLGGEAKELARGAFPNLGQSTAEGSVSAVVTAGASVRK